LGESCNSVYCCCLVKGAALLRRNPNLSLCHEDIVIFLIDKVRWIKFIRLFWVCCVQVEIVLGGDCFFIVIVIMLSLTGMCIRIGNDRYFVINLERIYELDVAPIWMIFSILLLPLLKSPPPHLQAGAKTTVIGSVEDENQQ